jgi:hypothetical protein
MLYILQGFSLGGCHRDLWNRRLRLKPRAVPAIWRRLIEITLTVHLIDRSKRGGVLTRYGAQHVALLRDRPARGKPATPGGRQSPLATRLGS